MSDRSSDDLRYLLDDLSSTLDSLRDELDERERRDRRGGRRGRDHDRSRGLTPPQPGRFLRFTEEYTIPTLISFLETNIRALELLQGLLGLLNGSDGSATRADRRQFEALGGRTMDQLDGLLTDLQDALEGRPTDPEASDLLDDARSLRREIDDRIAGRRPEDRRLRDRTGDRDRGRRRRDGGSVSIDVSDADDRRDADRNDAADEEADAPDDEVDVDAELDSIRREVHGDEGGDDGVDADADADGNGDEE